jgi:hypothetical protein
VKITGAADCHEVLTGLPDVLFYYPHDITLGSWTRSVIGPAIGAQDAGDFLLFEWHYAVAAILDSIDIQFDVAKATITAISNWDVTGSAGAGVKIACIVEDIVDVDVRGTLGPLKVDLAPCIDTFNHVVYFRTTITFRADPNLTFDVESSLLPFPLNEISGAILNIIADHIYKPNMSVVMDLFSIKLVEMNGLPLGEHPGSFRRSLRKDPKNNQSLAIGLGLTIRG